jgi:hypothetical protein
MIMDTKKLVAVYVDAMRNQYDVERRLHQVMTDLDSDNAVLSTTHTTLRDGYTSTIKHLLNTQYNFDWIEWWMWECDFGRESRNFFIDEEPYDVASMTFDRFYDLVISFE